MLGTLHQKKKKGQSALPKNGRREKSEKKKLQNYRGKSGERGLRMLGTTKKTAQGTCRRRAISAGYFTTMPERELRLRGERSLLKEKKNVSAGRFGL